MIHDSDEIGLTMNEIDVCYASEILLLDLPWPTFLTKKRTKRTQHKNPYINQHIPICIIFGNSHKTLHVENQPRKKGKKKRKMKHRLTMENDNQQDSYNRQYFLADSLKISGFWSDRKYYPTKQCTVEMFLVWQNFSMPCYYFRSRSRLLVFQMLRLVKSWNKHV